MSDDAKTPETRTPDAETTGGRDYLPGLILCGVGSILLGFLLLMMAGMMLLAARVAPPAGMTAPGGTGGSIGFSLVLGLFWLWLGLGTVRARRWARALQLIFSITSLLVMIVSGVVFTVAFKLIASGYDTGLELYYDPAELAAALPAVVVFSVIGVLIPLGYLLFFRLPGVKATCERLHPEPCWTDRCPLPVLTLAKLLVLTALSLLLMMSPGGPYGLAPAVALGLAAAFLLLAVETYRLRRWALWAAALLMLAVQILFMVGVSNVDPAAVYGQTGLGGDPAAAADALALSRIINIALTAALSLLWLGYCFWLRKFFPKNQGT